MRISDWSSDVCSSDLERAKETVAKRIEVGAPVPAARFEQQRQNEATRIARADLTLRQQERKPSRSRAMRVASRSEEHTSALQSLMRSSYAVFCLKKKKLSPLPSYDPMWRSRHSGI